jgi:Family of unknown function (DUF6339)
MSKYYAMLAEDGVRYLKARDVGEDPLLDDFQRVVGSGNFIDMEPITKLGVELRKLKKGFPASLKARDPEGGRFEQQACVIVHRRLAECDPVVLADRNFWIWLAIVQFADIVEWRFGTRGQHANLANYGIGQPIENLLFRLWLRAELVKDAKGKDIYHLARTGDMDLWRSHILRQSYANARVVAKALLRLQAGQLAAKKLTVDNVRELAKRLRRLHANVVFEFLNAGQAEGLVVELSADLHKK